jgi:hypothetical protein
MNLSTFIYCNFYLFIYLYFNKKKFIQDLPNSFAKLLLQSRQHSIILCGPSNNKIPCRLQINNRPMPNLQIGQGWTSYCAASNIINGDIICFEYPRTFNNNIVIVTKKYHSFERFLRFGWKISYFKNFLMVSK